MVRERSGRGQHENQPGGTIWVVKFWELSSLCREHPDAEGLFNRVAATRPEYSRFGQWKGNIEFLVDSQHREILDFELPDEFVIAVLECLDLPFYLGVAADGTQWLRSLPSAADDRQFTAAQAYRLYGNAHEDVQEYGIVRL